MRADVRRIPADRPPGAIGFEELIATARSALKITPRTDGDLAIVGYTSGTTGPPKWAMISQRALPDCVRLMPSLFRISSYGRCAFTGGTVTFLHPYTPESWADHIEADQFTFTYAPTPLIPAFAAEMRRRPKVLRSVESVIHSGSPVPRSHVQELVEVIGERYLEVWGMTEGVAPFSATTRADWRNADQAGATDVYASAGRAFPTASIRAVGGDGPDPAAGRGGRADGAGGHHVRRLPRGRGQDGRELRAARVPDRRPGTAERGRLRHTSRAGSRT